MEQIFVICESGEIKVFNEKSYFKFTVPRTPASAKWTNAVVNGNTIVATNEYGQTYLFDHRGYFQRQLG